MTQFVSIDFQNIFKIDEDHGFSSSDFEMQEKNISVFLSKIKERNQDFYSVIDDASVVTKIQDFAQKVLGRYEHVVVLGIGGSALGAMTLKTALGDIFGHSKPRLHIMPNIDPDLIAGANEVLTYDKTLFIVVSKSGETTETLAQYLYFREKIEFLGLETRKHFVFVTDPQKGLLRKIANEDKIPVFDVPENVGGRFSVLTAVGLLPACLFGINITQLLEGARWMRDLFLSDNFAKNLPFQLATIQFMSFEKGKNQNVFMPYSTRLRTLADWFTQLLAESTGKDGKGLTPIASMGVTDQHSLLQLLMQGANDKLMMFLAVDKFHNDTKISFNSSLQKEKLSFLKDISFEKLLNTERQATADALTENNRPNLTIKIPEISAQTMGALFLLFEGATAFLGEYLGINAFNQPGVERSKELTRKYLESSQALGTFFVKEN